MGPSTFKASGLEFWVPMVETSPAIAPVELWWVDFFVRDTCGVFPTQVGGPVENLFMGLRHGG